MAKGFWVGLVLIYGFATVASFNPAAILKSTYPSEHVQKSYFLVMCRPTVMHIITSSEKFYFHEL